VTLAQFVHDIDPVLGRVGGLYLWWYGLSYTLGFLGVFTWLRRTRRRLGMSEGDVYLLSVLLAGGVLLGGRLIEVFFYEWSYYGRHPVHIPAVWLGGMSTHGILLGGVAGTWLYCRYTGRSFLAVADALAIPGAYIMGMGRIGNFIDGQIVGSPTDLPWGVAFPDAEGFRHPVVLYDGLKNLLLIPLLLRIRRSDPPRGALLGHFVLWYGLLRVFVDLFREYRTDLFGFPPGQEFNLLLGVLGLVLVRTARPPGTATPTRPVRADWPVRAVFGLLLLVPLTIPSDWTQDVPARYGKRHPGLEHSGLYPRLSHSGTPGPEPAPDASVNPPGETTR
jgi:phosphatidylglycerol:prolipoprotein diacylglycerol transferase